MQLGRMRMIALMLFSCCSYCYCGSCGVCVFCCFCCRSPYACLVSQCLFFFVMISTSACLRLRGWGGETCCERQNFFHHESSRKPFSPSSLPIEGFLLRRKDLFLVCLLLFRNLGLVALRFVSIWVKPGWHGRKRRVGAGQPCTGLVRSSMAIIVHHYGSAMTKSTKCGRRV